MGKKAYIFMIDGIFALVILIIGFMVISSKAAPDLSETTLLLTAENVVDVLSTVKVDELCSGCSCQQYPLLSGYCSGGDVKNSDQTLYDYFGELYYRGKITDAGNLFSNITGSFYRKELFGVQLVIDRQNIYSDQGKAESEELISRKKVIFGFYEEKSTGVVRFWGPYVLEVNVWSR